MREHCSKVSKQMDQSKPKSEEQHSEKYFVKTRLNDIEMEEKNSSLNGLAEECVTQTDESKTNDKVSFEHLLDISGIDGLWTILMFLMCSFCGFTSPFQMLSYQFLGATPEHWCQVEELYASNWTDEQVLSLAIPFENSTGSYASCHKYNLNYTAAAALGYKDSLTYKASLALTTDSDRTAWIPCTSGHTFNLTQYSSTVVTEWDLVCERRALYSTTFGAVSVGKMIGYLSFGCVLDTFGRRRVVLLCSALFLVAGFLCSLSPNIEVYIFFRVIISIMDVGMYLGCFITSMEISPLKRRSFVGALFTIPWSLGYMLLPGIAYGIRTWKLLQVALTIPGLYTLVFFKYFPESPRWLILHGRFEEAFSVLKWGAEVNGKTVLAKDEMIQYMEKIRKDVMAQDDDDDDVPCIKGNLFSRAINYLKDKGSLYISPETRKLILVMLFCWFSVSMVYFGIALYATNLSVDPYLFIFLGGLLELPSYIMLWQAVTVIGRKKTFIGLYVSGAICILLLTTLLFINPNGVKWPSIFLAQAGKFLITAAFHLAFLYTAELFPTKYRPLALSQASFCGRIGSLFSPYINDILGTVTVWAPSALFGSLSLIAAILATALPETKDQNLPETNIFNKKKLPSPKMMTQEESPRPGSDVIKKWTV
ncbi:solute carrier family 22 member 7-like [Palaemon carinicauda]|uniref:solute carrier family 22 member 7-like n=1 Tax=Palaemon carinicauda TaxID=392227 RepID=UPI0035B594A6